MTDKSRLKELFVLTILAAVLAAASVVVAFGDLVGWWTGATNLAVMLLCFAGIFGVVVWYRMSTGE